MRKTSMQAMTSKWVLVVEEHERVKQKRSKHFHTVKALCDTFRVRREGLQIDLNRTKHRGVLWVYCFRNLTCR